MAALDHIPAGSKYNNLRGMLAILRRDFPKLYAGLSASRVRGWVSEIDSGTGRDADQVRDDIAQYVIGVDRLMERYGLSREEAELTIVGGNEGGINFSSLTPVSQPEPEPKPKPDPKPEPEDPDPDPDDDTEPDEAEPIDYHKRVRALYPFLPKQLVGIFADAWADSGDVQLALAEMRASDAYDTYFEGNRRDDGTLRHTEAEYFSIKDAYRTLYREYGLNPDLFEGRFTELIVNDQSPAEHARKLGAAFEQVVNNIPQVREAYARFGNIQMTDQAIFASVIDPTIGEAIINRRIAVAQVAGEGLARRFDVDEDFAGRLVSGGLDQMAARTLFSDAEGRLSTLDTLVRRHQDPDDDFDIEEFADANVFGDAVQNRRIQRALRAEASMFTEQAGAVSTSQGLQVRGLSAQ